MCRQRRRRRVETSALTALATLRCARAACHLQTMTAHLQVRLAHLHAVRVLVGLYRRAETVLENVAHRDEAGAYRDLLPCAPPLVLPHSVTGTQRASHPCCHQTRLGCGRHGDAGWVDAAMVHAVFRPLLEVAASVTIDLVVRIVAPSPSTAGAARHLERLKAVYRSLPTVPTALLQVRDAVGDDPEYATFVARLQLPAAPIRAGALVEGAAAVPPRVGTLQLQLLAACLAVWRRLGRRSPQDHVARAVWQASDQVVALLALTSHPSHVDLVQTDWIRHGDRASVGAQAAALAQASTAAAHATEASSWSLALAIDALIV